MKLVPNSLKLPNLNFTRQKENIESIKHFKIN